MTKKQSKRSAASPPLQRGRLRGGVRFILIAAISLDGRITDGKNEGTEWTSKEDQRFFRSELDKADAVILGRKTFETIPRPLTPRNRIVFSRSTTFQHSEECWNVVAFGGAKSKLLKLLNEKSWKRVVIAGGTEIYAWFLKNRLVDEIYLTLEPVIFGAGKALLAEGNYGGNWSLTSSRKLNKTGTLLLKYKLELSR